MNVYYILFPKQGHSQARLATTVSLNGIEFKEKAKSFFTHPRLFHNSRDLQGKVTLRIAT